MLPQRGKALRNRFLVPSIGVHLPNVKIILPVFREVVNGSVGRPDRIVVSPSEFRQLRMFARREILFPDIAGEGRAIMFAQRDFVSFPRRHLNMFTHNLRGRLSSFDQKPGSEAKDYPLTSPKATKRPPITS